MYPFACRSDKLVDGRILIIQRRYFSHIFCFLQKINILTQNSTWFKNVLHIKSNANWSGMMQYVVVPADRRFHLEMLWFLSCEEVHFKHIFERLSHIEWLKFYCSCWIRAQWYVAYFHFKSTDCAKMKCLCWLYHDGKCYVNESFAPILSLKL